MKHQHRSAVALVAASLLGGAGVVAAARVMSGPGPAEAATRTVPLPPDDPNDASLLSVGVHQLLSDSRQMDRRLQQARGDLTRQLQELSRLRVRASQDSARALSAAQDSARALTAAPSPTTPTAVPAVAPPGVHTTTGASGATGSDHQDNQEHDD